MLKVLVASSKGGAGKSTIATNLAAHFAVDGKNTVLVDADRQGSSLRWSEKRSVHANAVLGISGLRRDWERQVPSDAQRVVIDSAAGIRPGEVGDWLETELDDVAVTVTGGVTSVRVVTRDASALYAMLDHLEALGLELLAVHRLDETPPS